MEENDIKIFLKLGYWPVVVPTKNGTKWRSSIYKKIKGVWHIHKQRLFNNPFKSYEWVTEYLSNIYYSAEK